MASTAPQRQQTPASKIERIRYRLGQPIDIAGIVYFRIAFGAIMFWEMWRFLDPSHRWVEEYYTDKAFYFKYWPFTFTDPLPEPWIQVVFVLTAVAAVMVVIGLFYRLGATALFLGLTYIFLLEKARYLNHFYLICLLAFLTIFIPAHRSFSVDARRRPQIRADTAPTWTLWLLRFQIGAVYLFGGIAKLNADWLQGEPLRAWLSARTDFPLLGGLFTQEPVVWFMVYGALLLDLLVVFFLLYRPTRVFAYIATLAFHLINSRLFGIGIFPWTMIAATLIFFDPDWPRRVLADLREPRHKPTWRLAGLGAGALLGFWLGGYLPTSFSVWKAAIAALGVGVAGYHLALLFQPYGAETFEPERRNPPPRKQSAMARPITVTTLVLLLAWAGWQIAWPLRHYVIAGNVHWTEEGHNFAWHMKLRDKDALARFFVTAGGETFEIDNRAFLTERQISKMSTRPHMIVQYAHFLEDHFRSQGHDFVAVRAVVWATLNGRNPQLLIDPEFDLTTAGYPWFGHAHWILPLTEPLNPDSG